MKIVVSILQPEKRTKEHNEWNSIVKETNDLLANVEDTALLNDGTWQIDSEKGLPVLSYILHSAEAEKIPYRVLFVDSGDEWKRSF